MTQLNKLSLELLASAFAVEEVHGTVFAVFAHSDTIKTIQGFMSVIKEGPSPTLFGATYVAVPSVDKGSIVLGISRDGRGPAPTIEDFPKALQNRMAPDNYRPDGDVWSRLLSLQ